MKNRMLMMATILSGTIVRIISVATYSAAPMSARIFGVLICADASPVRWLTTAS